jgi:LmbE family N-acetylglucosaminyl deacetylase
MNFDPFLKANALLLAILMVLVASTYAQSPLSMDAAEIQQALKRLTVVGTALYVGAHPDDENTAFLAYLSKGRNVRTAYLSDTRGEGGQNLVGSEQGELLGILRTQELLAARRFDGAEQYFTRAIDFGFSKSSDETLNIWDHEKILSDVVWIIRLLQPDIIITRFTPTVGGHGNHLSSAILAQEAFQLAGDKSRFSDQLGTVSVWASKRILYNVANFGSVLLDTAGTLKVDIAEYNPLLGRSYTEIAGISRSMHKSQGFGAPQNRGSQINNLRLTNGEGMSGDMFDGVNLGWSRFARGEKVGTMLEDAYRTFRPENPSATIPLLLGALEAMNTLGAFPLVEYKKKELLEVVKACAGLWIDALAADHAAAPGTDVRMTASAIVRSDIPVTLEEIQFPYGQGARAVNKLLSNNRGVLELATVTIPPDAEYSQPYWLREKSSVGSYNIPDQRLIGMPENKAALTANVTIRIDQQRMTLAVPVRYRWVDPVEGELYRPLEVVPQVGINLAERVYMFSEDNEKTVHVTLHSGMPNVAGEVRLVAPEGWSSKPVSIPFQLQRKNDETTVSFTVGKASGQKGGEFRVEAIVGGKTISQGIVTVDHKHIPPQTLFPPAEGKLVPVDLKMKGNNIGYIVGSGDEVPTSLRQIGYNVAILSDEDLAKGDLSKFDALIAGVRVYNTRPSIRNEQKRLLEYVQNGGTYIVQYVTRQRLESENLGPYPFAVTNDRVTVETAPMTFVSPQHPVLNTPNKITEKDFEGWVQERGLYYADTLDTHYEPIFAANDPGESPKKGGLIVARYGKGYFMYTGLAFFRQLPAGIPGAYRLFVNMISLGK